MKPNGCDPWIQCLLETIATLGCPPATTVIQADKMPVSFSMKRSREGTRATTRCVPSERDLGLPLCSSFFNISSDSVELAGLG